MREELVFSFLPVPLSESPNVAYLKAIRCSSTG